jgi:hypothetical protein
MEELIKKVVRKKNKKRGGVGCGCGLVGFVLVGGGSLVTCAQGVAQGVKSK